jgi:Ca2+-binding RTX toxin-like protein
MPFINSDSVSAANSTPIVTLGVADELLVGRDADLSATHAGAAVVRLGYDNTVRVQGTLWSERHHAIEATLPNGLYTIVVQAGGLVAAADTALRLLGEDNTVVNAGEIGGFRGISMLQGSDCEITNLGLIEAWDEGVRMEGANQSLTNQGTIRAAKAVTLVGGNAAVVNTGLIESTAGVALRLDGTAASGARLENHGTVLAKGGAAVQMGAGADSVVNGGRILGAVQLLGGADLYDGAEGSVGTRVEGGADADTLLGGAGGDRLEGGLGQDEIDAGAGNDTVQGGPDADVLEGGEGIDLLSYAAAASSVRVDLGTGEAALGDAEGDAISGFEWLLGGRSGDTLTGSAGANRIFGAEGNDRLSGLDGRDSLLGGNGADTLVGGRGADLLWGGAGADRFRLEMLEDSTPGFPGMDRIRDFSKAEGDQIDLSALDGNGADPGDPAWVFIGSSGFSAAGQVRFFQSQAVTYVQLNTDGDAGAEATIQLLGLVGLAAGDFVF